MSDKPPDNASLAVSHALRGIADGIEQVLESVAGENMVFCLIVAKRGDPAAHGQRAQYVANIPRETAAVFLAEVLERWKVGGDRGPLHAPHHS